MQKRAMINNTDHRPVFYITSFKAAALTTHLTAYATL